MPSHWVWLPCDACVSFALVLPDTVSSMVRVSRRVETTNPRRHPRSGDHGSDRRPATVSGRTNNFAVPKHLSIARAAALKCKQISAWPSTRFRRNDFAGYFILSSEYFSSFPRGTLVRYRNLHVFSLAWVTPGVSVSDTRDTYSVRGRVRNYGSVDGYETIALLGGAFQHRSRRALRSCDPPSQLRTESDSTSGFGRFARCY